MNIKMIKIKEKLKCIHDFLVDSDRVNMELNWIRKLWYLVLLIPTSIYVFRNYSNVISFTFFEDFDGDNLIFLLWLVLLVLPLFDSFEVFGMKIQSHQERKRIDVELNQLRKDVIADSNIAPSIADLENKINNIQKDYNDEL